MRCSHFLRQLGNYSSYTYNFMCIQNVHVHIQWPKTWLALLQPWSRAEREECLELRCLTADHTNIDVYVYTDPLSLICTCVHTNTHADWLTWDIDIQAVNLVLHFFGLVHGIHSQKSKQSACRTLFQYYLSLYSQASYQPTIKIQIAKVFCKI